VTDDEMRAAASKALERGTAKAEIESDARVILLDDPHASGFAVEAWVYIMDVDTSLQIV
jgi:hypothetical protein